MIIEHSLRRLTVQSRARRACDQPAHFKVTMMCARIHLDLLADRISSIEIISIEQNECPSRARAHSSMWELSMRSVTSASSISRSRCRHHIALSKNDCSNETRISVPVTTIIIIIIITSETDDDRGTRRYESANEEKEEKKTKKEEGEECEKHPSIHLSRHPHLSIDLSIYRHAALLTPGDYMRERREEEEKKKSKANMKKMFFSAQLRLK